MSEENTQETIPTTTPEEVAPVVSTEQKQELAKAMASDIMADDNGLLLGKSLNDMYRIAKMLLVAKMIPKHYDTPEKVLAGMQFAKSLNLNPFVSLRQIAVINGMPSLWGDLPLGLVRRTGKLKYIKEFFIDKDYNEISFENKNLHAPMWGAICTIERDGYEKKSYTFTQLDYAKQGGQVKDIWNKFDKTMFMRKARGLGLKSEFSDVLEGVLIAEYDFNTIPDAGESYQIKHDGTPSQEARMNKFADKLNGVKPDVEVEVVE